MRTNEAEKVVAITKILSSNDSDEEGNDTSAEDVSDEVNNTEE
ncbi:hypothetical protein DFR98_004617 [Clostridium saccharobutylicum]|nr:hypothetical protein [Clostridium saccharobutylicum]NOW16581.1 hypothetical protein [Clostridium saccharobutylicum]